MIDPWFANAYAYPPRAAEHPPAQWLVQLLEIHVANQSPEISPR